MARLCAEVYWSKVLFLLQVILRQYWCVGHNRKCNRLDDSHLFVQLELAVCPMCSSSFTLADLTLVKDFGSREGTIDDNLQVLGIRDAIYLISIDNKRSACH